ncbi:MAG: flagellar basal body rod protein FlgC [Chitinispirillales bacterium]|jgi:flagellar basal-body rod protein FlgC|nr:flagellar basal body rod protein FlgC [Chitinispirillales bacterium]
MSSVGGIFGGLEISASGMRAQRIRQNAISSNLSNAETTRTAEGGPYRRQFVVFEAQSNKRDTRILNDNVSLYGATTHENHLPIPPSNFPRDERFFGRGVDVPEIRSDTRPPRLEYDPGHPDADEEGYVAMPNINVIEEMTDMIAATRAYEANVTAFDAIKGMLMETVKG